jgi:nucleoside 2-deoxyribosyltransferase
MTDHPPSAYLAGPDVFFPNAKAVGEEKKRILLRHGITGHFPLDNEISEKLKGADAAHAIFLQNAALIDRSSILIANIVPFRGPSLDPGTAWEIGYAYARGIPIICYGAAGTYLERCRALGIEGSTTGLDQEGLVIENFEETENLMISRCARHLVLTFEEAAAAAQKQLNS